MLRRHARRVRARYGPARGPGRMRRRHSCERAAMERAISREMGRAGVVASCWRALYAADLVLGWVEPQRAGRGVARAPRSTTRRC